jgi:hypothetical protein
MATWNLIGEIYGIENTSYSGYSISLSSDGNIIAIGALDKVF